jgi:GH43 family beta-xylosidase
MRKSPHLQSLTGICCALVVLLLLMPGNIAGAQPNEGEPGVLRNPLNPARGPDPWLVYYEGYYYLTATTGTSELIMRKSPTLAGLKTAPAVLIYRETEPSRCCNMWAPEFHLLDGPNGLRWYYYYTAGTAGTLDNQRTYVLESEGTDPLGPYTFKGRIFDPFNDGWAIDGSILELDDQMYFLFSSWVGFNQSLFIAPMSDPWTISGPRVLIAQPEYDWERQDGNVNEGPVALYRDDDIFIIYSASGCWTPNYKLGMLIYNGGDPLSGDSWDKHPEPVFQRSDENGVFAPGHNGFFKSPDGTEDWIVYHANDTVTGACDDGRTTRVQRFTWNEDGTPNFGVPVSTEEVIAAPSGDMGIDPLPDFALRTISRFRSYSLEGAYLRHFDDVFRVDFATDTPEDSHFIIMPGLADPEAVSIESANVAGYFLRHENNVIVLGPHDRSESFEADATWHIRPGLADEEWVSLESYNRPGSYIGRRFGITALVEVSDTSPPAMLEDATFFEESDSGE